MGFSILNFALSFSFLNLLDLPPPSKHSQVPNKRTKPNGCERNAWKRRAAVIFFTHGDDFFGCLLISVVSGVCPLNWWNWAPFTSLGEEHGPAACAQSWSPFKRWGFSPPHLLQGGRREWWVQTAIWSLEYHVLRSTGLSPPKGKFLFTQNGLKITCAPPPSQGLGQGVIWGCKAKLPQAAYRWGNISKIAEASGATTGVQCRLPGSGHFHLQVTLQEQCGQNYSCPEARDQEAMITNLS